MMNKMWKQKKDKFISIQNMEGDEIILSMA